MKTALITGSAGLVGSSISHLLLSEGWRVIGVDNNTRGKLFGKVANTHHPRHKNYIPERVDIRDVPGLGNLFEDYVIHFVVHAAGQPSHEWSADHPAEDWAINATGTMNVLNLTRQFCPDVPFAFMSTNKVYGDGVNDIPCVETETRYKYAHPEFLTSGGGVDEDFGVDQTTHSPFGASKLAADIMVQEFGRYYGLRTACFRAGCITGAAHRAVSAHGFLAYLVRCARLKCSYTVHGHKGKQVRDQLHASDLARLLFEFYKVPVVGEVFNVGGGQANSISILEAYQWLSKRGLMFPAWTYSETPRKGDHRCYITDLTKVREQWPGWSITMTLDNILEELCQAPIL